MSMRVQLILEGGITLPEIKVACVAWMRPNDHVYEGVGRSPTYIPSEAIKEVRCYNDEDRTASIDNDWIGYIRRSKVFGKDIDERVCSPRHELILSPRDSYAYAHALLSLYRIGWESITYAKQVMGIVQHTGCSIDEALVLGGLFNHKKEQASVFWSAHHIYSAGHKAKGYLKDIKEAFEESKTMPSWKKEKTSFERAILDTQEGRGGGSLREIIGKTVKYSTRPYPDGFDRLREAINA